MPSIDSLIERATPEARLLLWVVTLAPIQPVPFWRLELIFYQNYQLEIKIPSIDSLLQELIVLKLLQEDKNRNVPQYSFETVVGETCREWMNKHPSDRWILEATKIEQIYNQKYVPVSGNLQLNVTSEISISRIKQLISQYSKDICFDNMPQLPCAIKQIYIENYQGIINTHVSNIPVNSQWIFLTGENSFGITSVLQAIAIGLFGKHDKKRILTEDECQICIELKNNGLDHISHLGLQPFTNFVAY
ncbi:MAG: hypothetical protein KAI17_22660, partial [Thiotrichaceae bacterium]|nr:hypothetical protein [Thiotrichaceae bacterium]